jgi:uncharacterized membrane protein YfcA
MEWIVGFLIAAAVGITGVGAGSITAPVLILFFHVPAAQSVGTALAFSAAIKLFVVPVQMYRGQVDYRVLKFMLTGGVPGVLLGSALLARLSGHGQQGLLYAVLGSTVALMAALNLYRQVARRAVEPPADRTRWLPLAMLPIGAEVGFSSAGAGALGTLALLGMTPLRAAQVVGTDLCFGLILSLTGSGFQLSAGNYDPAILLRLIAGGLAGAFAGVSIAGMAPQRAMRAALSLWLIGLGLQLCWSGVSHW